MIAGIQILCRLSVIILECAPLLHCTVQCSAVHWPALKYSTVHCTALHCTALQWTALHWTPFAARHCFELGEVGWMQGIRAVPAAQAAVRRYKGEIKLREMLSGQFAVRTLLQLSRYQMWEGCRASGGMPGKWNLPAIQLLPKWKIFLLCREYIRATWGAYKYSINNKLQ